MKVLNKQVKSIHTLNSGEKDTNIKHWKFSQNSTKFFVKCVLSKFDLAHVKVSYSADFEVFVDDLGSGTSTS